ncbi:amidohydrolase family protein [Yinghuangia seranimata]|uniref:amidohydrolase family protein n=1 Tax=Yinghuangia seranimata TaxID=408067 RepID=UPI00248B88D5|nr:amidohydrolase family protein [Yinghuangia seranimata]MDI2129406.1 amidohydrolase family protein [Yinghuangia seranimata]
MYVYDVDSHFEPPSDWLDAFPSLKRRLPELFPQHEPEFALRGPEQFAYFVSDGIRPMVPQTDRVPLERLVTPFLRAMYPDDGPATINGHCQHPTVDADARIAALDAQGIAVQNVISGAGYTLMRCLSDPELARDTARALNTYLSDAMSAHRDRLLPVTVTHFDELDWVVAELTRMRARGSRAFHVTTEFSNNIPPFHPDFDKVWSAATDLGMVAVLHVGMMPPRYHPAYSNTDDPSLITRMSTSQSFQAAQVYLNAMVFGGVFERHPNLTLLLCETGIDWLEFAVANMDGRAAPASAALLGPYELPLKPSEYIQRNVRISPLPQPAQSPVRLFETLPGVAVFSSDMPHFEGSLAPVEFWRGELADVDGHRWDAFVAGSMADAYARMGDPLPKPVAAA